MVTLDKLRHQAVSQSLFLPTDLASALAQLAFVQADPIRAPARAQDLILRHRVVDYHAGDLERRYPELEVEEDFLYAYGFLARPYWQLLYPKPQRRLSKLEQGVFATVVERGATHPRDLEGQFGSQRVLNAWGGFSKVTKHALERLHRCGYLRIAKRSNGIRIYEAAMVSAEPLPATARLRRLLQLLFAVFSPLPDRSLAGVLALMRRVLPEHEKARQMIQTMVKDGELQRHVVDGVSYTMTACGESALEPDEPRVRFLAPFDPIVWDRRRFEHFWGWPYRFEAYTPLAKRLRGYYAMPLLWRSQVVGWANAQTAGGKLAVEVGYARSKPREKIFNQQLEAEIAALGEFLMVVPS